MKKHAPEGINEFKDSVTRQKSGDKYERGNKDIAFGERENVLQVWCGKAKDEDKESGGGSSTWPIVESYSSRLEVDGPGTEDRGSEKALSM